MRYFLCVFIVLFFVSGFAQTPSDVEKEFAIEKVPVYPGCEIMKTNEDLKNCMFRKISEYIAENFNLNSAGKLKLKGRQRIEVLFTIDKRGRITDIEAKGPHLRLEKEAKRVLMSLPRMTPGEQKGIPVDILYALPIVFDME